jgi:hypothetical protein
MKKYKNDVMSKEQYRALKLASKSKKKKR